MSEFKKQKLSKARKKNLLLGMRECPFCAKKDGDIILVHFHHWACICNSCDAQGPVCVDPYDAMDAWNKRRKKPDANL